jgi:hypothetical protein
MGTIVGSGGTVVGTGIDWAPVGAGTVASGEFARAPFESAENQQESW